MQVAPTKNMVWKKTFHRVDSTSYVACRTGVIFCVFQANIGRKPGERDARVAREGRRQKKVPRISRFPCFRLCSPKIRQKFRLFCKLVRVSLFIRNTCIILVAACFSTEEIFMRSRHMGQNKSSIYKTMLTGI